jgi:hypothetical protein
MEVLYPVPYLLFAFFLVVLFFLNDKRIITVQQSQISIGFVFLIFVGLRGFIGYDWYTYYPFFQASPTIFELQIDDFFSFLKSGESVEPGFVLYVALIKSFTSSWYLFTFISTLIDYVVISKLLRRYSTNFPLAFLIYFSFGLSMQVDLFRNMKALLLIILSFDYVVNRKIWPFIGLVLLAFLFHRTSLFFLPLYFLGGLNYTRVVLIILLCVYLAVLILDFNVFVSLVDPFQEVLGGSFQSRLYWYGQNENFSSERGLTIGLFYRVTTFILVIKYVKSLMNYEHGKLLIALFIMYSSLYFVFNDFELVVFRFELLLGISLWILWPLIRDFLNPKSVYRVLYTVSLISICLFKVAKQTNNRLYDYDHAINNTEYEARIQSHYMLSDAVN